MSQRDELIADFVELHVSHEKNLAEERRRRRIKVFFLNRPKRTPTPYLLFSKKISADKAKDPEFLAMSFSEKGAYIGRLWQALSDAEKSTYEQPRAIAYNNNRRNRPFGDFITFNAEHPPGPGVSITANASANAKIWKSMTDEQKAPYRP